jgi:osmotically-inducible protein OsmY
MKKRLPLLFMMVLFLLSACVPAAFVVGATTGGVVISDRRNFETILQDKKITYKAIVQLNSEPLLKGESHITVTTFNRVVLLVGQAATPELRKRAYELVKSVPNIRRINNAIVVAEPTAAITRSKDTWITTKVKTALLAEKGLNSTQIKVITEACTVYLIGLVTHQQAEIATDVARQVDGVEKVVTLFEYIS